MIERKGLGEKKIAKILKEHGFNYSTTKRLTNLKKDVKKFRIPDFYLEDYDLIIEYFSSWHIKKNKALEKIERSRFMEKVGAYESSNINCLYLYPEDEPVFEKKILKKIQDIEKNLKKARELLEEQQISTIIIKNEEKVEEEHIVEEEIEPVKKVEKEKRLVYQPSSKPVEKEKVIKKPSNDLFKKIILGLSGLCLLLFCLMTLVIVLLVLNGVPMVSDLYNFNQGLFLAFSIGLVLSIIFSFLFAIEKNISKGLIYVAVILIVFFFLLLVLFGNPLTQVIIVLVGMFGIIPSQFFMVMEN